MVNIKLAKSEVKELKKEREELVKIVKKLELMSIMNMEIIDMYEEILNTSNQDCKSAKLKALSFMENT